MFLVVHEAISNQLAHLFKPAATERSTVPAMRAINLWTLGMLACCALASSPDQAPDKGIAEIDKLGWLAGHWCLEQDGQFIEEYWLPPRGGRIVAMGRTTVQGISRSFEFLRIEMRSNVPTFVAQPEGNPPVPFAMTSSGPRWAVFENPEHDFPKRVEYRRTDKGLWAQISGPGEGGKDQVIAFDYSLCTAK